MSFLNIPSEHRSDYKPFAMLANEPQKMRESTERFARFLEMSFWHDGERYGAEFAERHNNEAERRRRTAIMFRWYNDLRNSGYGHIQSMDEIPKALRAELDGEDYTPPKRNRLWVP